MRDLVTITVSLIAVLAVCKPVECETGFLVRTRLSEDPLDSEPVIKNKIIASSRFWGKRSLPDDLRRASLRWGKRWDPKVWKQSYSELLHPINIVSPGWSPIRTNDKSDDMAPEGLRRGCVRISWRHLPWKYNFVTSTYQTGLYYTACEGNKANYFYAFLDPSQIALRRSVIIATKI